MKALFLLLSAVLFVGCTSKTVKSEEPAPLVKDETKINLEKKEAQKFPDKERVRIGRDRL